MNESIGSLLNQGLIMTVFGMGLVFGALALLWGLMRLLTEVFRDKAEAAPTPPAAAPPAPAEVDAADIRAKEALTAERARVAALVTGALFSNALPLLLEPPAGPAFEHGRVAPSWVVGNRAQALQVWSPQRKPEVNPGPINNY